MEPMIISGVLLPLAQMEDSRAFLEKQGWCCAESAQGVNLRIELKARPALFNHLPDEMGPHDINIISISADGIMLHFVSLRELKDAQVFIPMLNINCISSAKK